MVTEGRVTISDIAKEVGVSTTTVSRFLSGQYKYMSKSTRENIADAVEKYDYRPSLMARGLKSSRSFLLGVVMPQVHLTASSHSIRGVCLACAGGQYSPIIVSIENDTETEAQKIQELIDHRVDGILTFTGSGDEYYQSAISNGIPVVRVDRHENCAPIDKVYINHYEAVQDALLNLSLSGYTKIAILFGSSTTSRYSTVNTRRRSYLDFVAASSSLEPIEYNIVGSDVNSIRDAISDFIRRYPNDRKAIFVSSLEHLATVDWICKLMGLNYPKDIAILGYALEDDTSVSNELSVISLPTIGMCQTAMSLISARITGGILPDAPVSKAISAPLLIRKSTIPFR